ncbi:MAG TPA: TadE family protein [Ilumatobacter sp.]|nr:TadE family protein [Ilumatobacter sp.]
MTVPARAARRARGDQGVTTVQVAVLFPAVLFLLVLIVQFGLWWHAKQVANGAAAEAVAAARTPAGNEAAGEQAAFDYLSEAGNLTRVTVVVDRDIEAVTVTVTGNAPRLVPGFAWGVTAVSQAAVERFIPADQR